MTPSRSISEEDTDGLGQREGREVGIAKDRLHNARGMNTYPDFPALADSAAATASDSAASPTGAFSAAIAASAPDRAIGLAAGISTPFL